MKKIMTVVICLFVVLSFSICGAANFKKPKKLKGGQIVKIEYIDENGDDQIVEFAIKKYDNQGNPEIVEVEDGKPGNTPWGERAYGLPAGSEEIISIHHVNPRCVRVNGVLRCK